jgi:hypothetical protein
VEPPDDELESSSLEIKKPAKVVTSPSATAAAIRGWEDKEQRARERAKGPEKKEDGTRTSIAISDHQ